MNSLALMLTAYLALGNHQSESLTEETHKSWTVFKAQHGRNYQSRTVDAMRKTIFLDNKQRIELFNEHLSEAAGFRLGVNHLTDRTTAEIAATNGFKLMAENEDVYKNSPEAERFLQNILAAPAAVPEEVDWRKVPGRVTRVKNQGQCGSCWAFASTGVLEGQQVRTMSNRSVNSGELIELSEQNIMDCVDNGCGGGIMDDAFNLVHKEGGIDSEQSYPYEEKAGECRFTESNSVMTDAGSVLLPEGDEDILKTVVARYGPVSVAIDDSSPLFHYYEGGIYNNPNCGNKSNDLGHAVLVVGYGTDPKGGDFWIIKNSWSEKWGEGGFGRMTRNAKNQCGIATHAVIAHFDA